MKTAAIASITGLSPNMNNGLDFVYVVNEFIATLYELAAIVRAQEPGTAEIIAAFAETVASSALDLVRTWPA